MANELEVDQHYYRHTCKRHATIERHCPTPHDVADVVKAKPVSCSIDDHVTPVSCTRQV